MAYQFKEGDHVRIRNDCSGPEFYTAPTVQCYPVAYMGSYTAEENNQPNKKTMLNKITSQIKRLLDPEKQTLYKAGYLDNCGNITTEGWEELKYLVLVDYQKELLKLAEGKIAEEKETK